MRVSAGQSCVEAGRAYITTEAECESAAEAIEYRDVSARSSSNPTSYPRGCWISAIAIGDSGTLYFNTNTLSIGNSRDAICRVCTGEGSDRYNPNHGTGGCCGGLRESTEDRPSNDSAYCLPSDAGHDTSCWSTWVLCRSSEYCTQMKMASDELLRVPRRLEQPCPPPKRVSAPDPSFPPATSTSPPRVPWIPPGARSA